MTPASLRLRATSALLLCALALPAWADSSASSAVSDSVSASVGSISGSLQKSSNSSSKGDNVAAGDYRVVALVEAPARPGEVQVTMQALDEPGIAGELQLTLPRSSAEEGRLAAGQVVTARTRPYGVEFARRADGRPFFLVLADEWYRELQTRVVAL